MIFEMVLPMDFVGLSISLMAKFMASCINAFTFGSLKSLDCFMSICLIKFPVPVRSLCGSFKKPSFINSQIQEVGVNRQHTKCI